MKLTALQVTFISTCGLRSLEPPAEEYTNWGDHWLQSSAPPHPESISLLPSPLSPTTTQVWHMTQAGQPIIEPHAPSCPDWLKGEDTWLNWANGVLQWDSSSLAGKWNPISALVIELLRCDPGSAVGWSLFQEKQLMWIMREGRLRAQRNTYESQREKVPWAGRFLTLTPSQEGGW